MANENNVGTVPNSIRKEVEPSKAGKTDIRQENNSERKKIVFPKPNSKDSGVNKPNLNNIDEKKLSEACMLINAFVQKCAQHPDCRAKALINLSAEFDAFHNIGNFKEPISPDTTIHDAAAIWDIMDKLEKNYFEEHDHANKALTEILSHHTPLLMYWFDFENEKRKNLEQKMN